jgi:hypothetical protein
MELKEDHYTNISGFTACSLLPFVRADLSCNMGKAACRSTYVCHCPWTFHMLDSYTKWTSLLHCLWLSCWGDPCSQVPGEGQPIYLACTHGDPSKPLVNLSSEVDIIIGVTEWKEELYSCWDFDCISAVKCGSSRTKYDLNRQIHDQWSFEQVTYQCRPTWLCSLDVKKEVL